MTACGYPVNVAYGENIAAGYGTAASVFMAWKNSPPHNSNMLDSRWKVMGIGFEIVPGSAETTYWTTDFGSYVDGTAHENGRTDTARRDPTDGVDHLSRGRHGGEGLGDGYHHRQRQPRCYPGRAVCRRRQDRDRLRQALRHSLGLLELQPRHLPSGSPGFRRGGQLRRLSSVTIHVSSSPSGTTTTTSTSTTTTTTTGTHQHHDDYYHLDQHQTTTTTAPPGAGFADVPATNVFYRSIMGLAAAGVVSGYSDGCFRPTEPRHPGAVRQDNRAGSGRAHLRGRQRSATPPLTTSTTQGALIPFDYVEEAVGLNIINGYSDGTLRPRSRRHPAPVGHDVGARGRRRAGHALRPATPALSQTCLRMPERPSGGLLQRPACPGARRRSSTRTARPHAPM